MRMQYNLVVEMRAFLYKQGSAKSENDPNLNYRGSQLCFFFIFNTIIVPISPHLIGSFSFKKP